MTSYATTGTSNPIMDVHDLETRDGVTTCYVIRRPMPPTYELDLTRFKDAPVARKGWRQPRTSKHKNQRRKQ